VHRRHAYSLPPSAGVSFLVPSPLFLQAIGTRFPFTSCVADRTLFSIGSFVSFERTAPWPLYPPSSIYGSSFFRQGRISGSVKKIQLAVHWSAVDSSFSTWLFGNFPPPSASSANYLVSPPGSFLKFFPTGDLGRKSVRGVLRISCSSFLP